MAGYDDDPWDELNKKVGKTVDMMFEQAGGIEKVARGYLENRRQEAERQRSVRMENMMKNAEGCPIIPNSEAGKTNFRCPVCGKAYDEYIEESIVNCYCQFPEKKREVERRVEKKRIKEEESKRREEENRRQREQSDAWEKQGLCRHCGGQIGGLFTKKCKSCGIEL
jgi:hypothetical protein